MFFVLQYVVCLPLTLKVVVCYEIKGSEKSQAWKKKVAELTFLIPGYQALNLELALLIKCYSTRCVKEYKV